MAEVQGGGNIRRLSNVILFYRWPISLRLIVTMIVVVLIPLLAFTLILAQEINESNTQNVEDYVQNVGSQQVRQFNSLMSNIQREMIYIAEQSTFASDLRRLLTSTSPSPAQTVRVTSLIEQQLVYSGFFDQVYLLDLQGNTILSSLRATPATTTLAQLISAGSNAGILGDPQRTIVDSETETANLLYVRVIYQAGQPVGYLGGVLSRNTILDLLDHSASGSVQARSYLATVNGSLFVSEDQRAAAIASFATAPVVDALGGVTGITSYTVNGEGMLAYFTQLDRGLVLITEASTRANFSITSGYVYGVGILVVLAGMLLAVLFGLLLGQTIIRPIRVLARNLLAMRDGDFDQRVRAAERPDEFRILGRALVSVREQLRQILEAFEDRIAAHARYVEITQDISRYAATQRDLQVLMDDVVSLIVEQFASISHAQIFLVDEPGIWAVLRSSTGEAGQQLLARGHRLEVGGNSVVGRAVGDRRTVIVRDTQQNPIHRPNVFLADTRAELAIALRVGDRAIGVLDVQSVNVDSFTDDQIVILETMANQIAMAIENARLYQEVISRLERTEVASREETLANWHNFMRIRKQNELRRHAGTATETDTSLVRQDAMLRGVPSVGEQTERQTIPFAVPIRFRGQTLGAVEWELPVAAFSDHKVQLAQELVNRLALSLENARLFEESTEATDRERLVNMIATQLTTQTDIDDILRTAVREVGQALQAPQVSIRLALDGQHNGHQLTPDDSVNGATHPAEHSD